MSERKTPKVLLMADLPEERLVASTLLFSNVGLDHFGSFTVKIGQRNEKSLCFLLTSLTVRVVNIEKVPKLDTYSCLNAMMRFIDRRSKAVKMISDKGTNFIGAEGELADYIAACHKKRIEEHLSQQGIRGKSKSNAAPHFGGLWERMVRSCKKTMYPVLGYWSISEDVIPNTMCFVEQAINARPLKPVGSDLNDLEAVTPNHFLFVNRIV